MHAKLQHSTHAHDQLCHFIYQGFYLRCYYIIILFKVLFYIKYIILFKVSLQVINVLLVSSHAVVKSHKG